MTGLLEARVFRHVGREGRTLERLNELYAVTDQVGFKMTERLDGRLILPEAVKCLQMKA